MCASYEEIQDTKRKVGEKHTFRGLIPAAATYMSSFPIGIPMP